MPYNKPLRRSHVSDISRDRANFSRTADGTNRLNVSARPMRGGIRL